MDASNSCSSRKSMKKAANSALDSAVYMWFLQKRALDQPISGPILQEKALDFSTKLSIDNFVASSGWLRNFQRRYGIRELKINGEKLSADNETGLVWKCLPKTSLVSTAEKTASGFKSLKERVTLLCCANTTGSDRLPLLLVGKSKQYQQKAKRSGKVLLIIDSAPCHLSSEWLDQADGGDLVSQLKSISLKDCCCMIAQAWDSISGHTLGVSWKKLLGYNEECVNQSIECDEDFANVTEMFKKFKLSQDEGEQWLVDDDTPLFETLTDEEILNAVKKDENEDVEESDMPDKPTERLSHSEA
ncbi:Jerky -like protein-like [Trichinella nelsoni]|uniref:Jerky-like protein-like n=1 Tax=Trichinella nelsoni TaxID=6336 RepID=A0A0V0SAQ7_9BILA|nr:Jerky -like protein-like [Trichinella nelsoni]